MKGICLISKDYEPVFEMVKNGSVELVLSSFTKETIVSNGLYPILIVVTDKKIAREITKKIKLDDINFLKDISVLTNSDLPINPKRKYLEVLYINGKWIRGIDNMKENLQEAIELVDHYILKYDEFDFIYTREDHPCELEYDPPTGYLPGEEVQ